jgi:acyl-CoA thioesterase I
MEPGRFTIAFLGDSLTEGFGVAPGEGFAERVGGMLAERGRPVRVLNAGVSGDTSYGALRRLSGALARKPDLLVIEIGVNDFFSGIPVQEVEQNLRATVGRAREEGVTVLLADVRIPSEYRPERSGYADVYARIGAELGVQLLPFPLDEVAADAALVLPDGLHPNARGYRRLAEAVLPGLFAVLEESVRTSDERKPEQSLH